MIKTFLVTVSDTRSAADDISGDRLEELVREAGFEIAGREVMTDDLAGLREALFALCGREDIDLILTTGGTGFGPRDNTPEATLAVIEREAPGLAEAMRRETAGRSPFAMLSRAVCGIRGRKLIVNLPGSTKGVEECFSVIRPALGHAVRLIRGDKVH